MTHTDTQDLGIADRVARDAVTALSTLWDPWSRVSDPVWERTGRLGTVVLDAVLHEAAGSAFDFSIRSEVALLRAAPLDPAIRERLIQKIRHLLAQLQGPAPSLQAAVETFVLRNRIVQQTGALYDPDRQVPSLDPRALLAAGARERRGMDGFWLCTVVVHFRARGALRRRNAIASICALLDQTMPRSDFRIVVVEQDREPMHADLLAASVDHYVFAANSGQYNRSWGRNVGAVATRGRDEYLFFADADLLLPRDFLEGCLAVVCARAVAAMLPHASLLYLDDVSSDLAIRDRLSAPRWAADFTSSHGYRLITNRGGCIFVSSREFHAANGYDERYEGWGDEDNEFFDHIASRGPIGQLAHDPIHLHHERPIEADADSVRLNEWLVGLERDPNAVIGDVGRYAPN